MGGKGSGRPPNVENLIKKQREELQPMGPGIFIPNLSGDHSKGRTGTPVADYAIANKKYVDDNSGIGGLSGSVTANTSNISGLSGSVTANTSNISGLSGSVTANTTHRNDTSDPHGATLTQTNITSSGSFSGGLLVTVGDHGWSGSNMVVNAVYGTGATPPTASTTTEGCIYLQYTA